MAQHFLLSAKARRLPIEQVALLSDAEIFALLKNARWHSDTEQVCPRCGVCHQAYFIHTRQQFQCKHCQYRFSITTGTIFQFHKLSLRQILIALLLFVTESKGLACSPICVLRANVAGGVIPLMMAIKQVQNFGR